LTKKELDIINCERPAKMAIFEIQSYIEAIEKNATLYEEKNFEKRIEVIDFIGFHVIDQIEELLRKTDQPDKLIFLKYSADKVRAELEEIDINLFQTLQANIRMEGYTGKEFKNLINEYVYFNLEYNEHQEDIGYDNLDIFINGLSPFQTMPEQTKDLEPEMVYYQKTPARIVFELVEKSHFMKEDVFFDLGSGLGQAAILVNLLAGITAKGIEIEPAFCDYAKDCAAALNLSNVTFINVDARKADYSEGTIFFMFTPFNGEILQEVLAILRKESLLRKIKIITYGPCTTQVALQSWLDFAAPQDSNIYKLGVFTSL
jgi:tRNA/tmRNA/rRNA uracil-C5-methylase (TrmA/RlmC/RlmD family)